MTLEEVKDEMLRLNQNDLAKINTLIAKYENEEPIKSYLVTHECKDNAVLDFYERCKNKKQEIDNWIDNTTDREQFALTVSSLYDAWQIRGTLSNKDYFMRPYFKYGEMEDDFLDYEYFSNKKIHKHIFSLIGTNSKEMELILNSEGKKTLYMNLMEIIKPSDIFSSWKDFLKEFTILSDRLPIFEELEKLWNNNLYYGFYSLSLLQIEGIFTILIEDIAKESLEDAGSNVQKKALIIRRLLSEKNRFTYMYAMDYFAHIIPLQRHKLAHTGLPIISKDEIKEKVVENLYDLKFLLNLFIDFPFPKTEFYQIIKENDITYYSNLSNFLFFIESLEKIDGKQSGEIFSFKIPHFENLKQQLIDNIIIEKLVLDICTDLEFEIDTLSSAIPCFVKDNTNLWELSFITQIENEKVRQYLSEDICQPFKNSWNYLLNAYHLWCKRSFIKEKLQPKFLEIIKPLEDKHKGLFIQMKRLQM